MDMKQLKEKKLWLIGGCMLLALVALPVGMSLMKRNSQTAELPGSRNQMQKDAMSLKSKKGGDDETDFRMNGTRMRWRDEKWEYSTDGGKTWTDTSPDGIKAGKNGSITMGGKGESEEVDPDAYEQEMEKVIDELMNEVTERYGDIMPEGREGSAFTFGDTIARQTDGVWEFSTDGGESWTNQPPDGIEVSEDGKRLRIGGQGEGDINDFDLDEWLDQWDEEFSKNSTDDASESSQDYSA